MQLHKADLTIGHNNFLSQRRSFIGILVESRDRCIKDNLWLRACAMSHPGTVALGIK